MNLSASALLWSPQVRRDAFRMLVSTRFSEPSLLTSDLAAAAVDDDVIVFIHAQILLSRPHLGKDIFRNLR